MQIEIISRQQMRALVDMYKVTNISCIAVEELEEEITQCFITMTLLQLLQSLGAAAVSVPLIILSTVEHMTRTKHIITNRTIRPIIIKLPEEEAELAEAYRDLMLLNQLHHWVQVDI